MQKKVDAAVLFYLHVSAEFPTFHLVEQIHPEMLKSIVQRLKEIGLWFLYSIDKNLSFQMISGRASTVGHFLSLPDLEARRHSFPQ